MASAETRSEIIPPALQTDDAEALQQLRSLGDMVTEQAASLPQHVPQAPSHVRYEVKIVPRPQRPKTSSRLCEASPDEKDESLTTNILPLEQGHTKPSIARKRHRRSVGEKLAISAVTSMALITTGSVAQPVTHEQTSYQIVGQDNQCPANSQFLIVNNAGLGNNKIGVFAANRTSEIVGETFDECDSALIYGDTYSEVANALTLRELLKKTHQKFVILFAHSFGSYALVDMLNEYTKIFPDDETRFFAVYFSSPGSQDDLRPGSFFGAHLLAALPPDQNLIEIINYFSILSQGDKSPFDPQLNEDAKTTAHDTPATLVKGETSRIIEEEGMGKFSPEAKKRIVGSAYIADKRDGVVDVLSAPSTIEQKSDVPLDQVIYIDLSDSRMSYHAALWWIPNGEDYKASLISVISAAVKALGANAVAPHVVLTRGTRDQIPR